MEYFEINAQDRHLIEIARDVITRNFDEDKYRVGAAVLCQSGEIHVGVNIESCGFGPCAEPIALGAAISHGERKFLTIVAVGGPQRNYGIMPPCGNCRQLLKDHAPDILVIVESENRPVKVRLDDLLPLAYSR